MASGLNNNSPLPLGENLGVRANLNVNAPLPLEETISTTPPPSFGRLARRISSVTTNSLLTAIVLVAGIGFGRQVLQWWSPERSKPQPEHTPTLPAEDLSAPDQFHWIRFSDHAWSLARHEISGDQTQAAQALKEFCRRLLPKCSPPRQMALPEEKSLLKSLSEKIPFADQPPLGKLYTLEETLPLVLGTNGEKKSRLCLWALALPEGTGHWTLLAFASSPEEGGNETTPPAIPLPPKCRKMLSIQAVKGESATGFSGPVALEECKLFYRQWFQQHGWKPVSAWQLQKKTAWYAQYKEIFPPQRTVNIHCSTRSPGGVEGLLFTVR
jgi:hypothetical protein